MPLVAFDVGRMGTFFKIVVNTVKECQNSNYNNMWTNETGSPLLVFKSKWRKVVRSWLL